MPLGNQIAEYSTVVADRLNAKVAYLTNDHLGSPRINTEAKRCGDLPPRLSPIRRRDRRTGGRTTGLNYGDDIGEEAIYRL